VFELFTSLAKRSIVVAQDEALALGHDFIGTGHLLLGLARVPEGVAGDVLAASGITADRARPELVAELTARGVTGTAAQDAADALAGLGIDVAQIRQRAEETFGPGRFIFPRPPYTPGAREALIYATRQGHELSRDAVGTEHMLLGVLADAGGTAARVLARLGAEPASVQADIRSRLAAAS
jgi:ATP-dependent Clp protease ATP-binding subunit ClpA